MATARLHQPHPPHLGALAFDSLGFNCLWEGLIWFLMDTSHYDLVSPLSAMLASHLPRWPENVGQKWVSRPHHFFHPWPGHTHTMQTLVGVARKPSNLCLTHLNPSCSHPTLWQSWVHIVRSGVPRTEYSKAEINQKKNRIEWWHLSPHSSDPFSPCCCSLTFPR